MFPISEAGRDTYWHSARSSVGNIVAILAGCGIKQSGISADI
ncbi:hypothetical protein ACT3TX_17915 [Halomonas sp. AOP23-I1-17]